MMRGAPAGELLATVTLNLALAIAVGAGISDLWLASRGSPWAAGRRNRLSLAGAAAVAAALLASGALLWLKAAAMAEVPLTDAGAAAWSMLTATHFGLAWTAGTSALALGALAIVLRRDGTDRRRWIVLNLSALAAFLYTRSTVSHASAESDFGIRILVDWFHLVLVSVWVGEVVIAGLLTLAAAPSDLADDRIDCKGYIEGISTTATYALAGIVVTGLANAWFNVGSPAALVGNAYGSALLAKLALVAIAVLLGGFNRFFVLPSLTAAGPVAAPALRRFTTILRIEAVVLSGVLILAAILSSTPPPTAG